jgi:competence protein ComGC
MLSIITPFLAIFAPAILITFITSKITKSERILISVLLVTLVISIISWITLVPPFIENKKSVAIKEWCANINVTYISHYKVKKSAKSWSVFGDDYRLTTMDNDVEIKIQVGNWLTGNNGWNVSR